MCNGFNHSFGCGCNWGGNTGGRGQNFNPFSGFSPRETKLSSGKKGYRIKCWWCSADVYYHTEGFNDCVLFDELGYPWKIHECWEQYKREKINTMNNTKNTSTNQQNVDAQQIFNAQQRFPILSLYLKKFQSPPDEDSIARKMGMSVERFRMIYGDLYYLDAKNRVILHDYRKVEQNQIIFEKMLHTQQQYAKTQEKSKPKILSIKRARILENDSTQ